MKGLLKLVHIVRSYHKRLRGCFILIHAVESTSSKFASSACTSWLMFVWLGVVKVEMLKTHFQPVSVSHKSEKVLSESNHRKSLTQNLRQQSKLRYKLLYIAAHGRWQKRSRTKFDFWHAAYLVLLAFIEWFRTARSSVNWLLPYRIHCSSSVLSHVKYIPIVERTWIAF